MTIFGLYQTDGHQAKRVASTNGGEYAGPCPACGGEDRFHLWPETGRWWCRQCDRSGDLPGYMMEFHGMTYPAAMEHLNLALPKRLLRAVPKPQPWSPAVSTPPPAPWLEKALALVKWANDQLWSGAGAQAVTYLTGRGLSHEAIKAAGLGLIPGDMWRGREDWGLEGEVHQDGPRKGQPKRLWIPGGLVIPTFGPGDEVVAIKVRRWEGEPRYYRLPGSNSRCLVTGQGQAAMVVESELDALLVGQVAGDLVTAVALGSAQARPDAETHALLEQAPVVFLSLDADPAGAKAAWGWWRDTYSQAKRWPVPQGKDPSGYFQAGGSVRAWVEAGLADAGRERMSTPPAIPAATAKDAQELQGWPPETQRVYCRVLDYLEAQGHPLVEAESLALAVVRLLMKRRRGPLCLVSDLPPAIGQAMGMALDVFGACSTSWTPERREVL